MANHRNDQRVCSIVHETPNLVSANHRLKSYACVVDLSKFIFGWLTEIEAKQELVDIVEFGSYVTCFLHISDKDGGILDVVEVFKIDDSGKVEEIWAL